MRVRRSLLALMLLALVAAGCGGGGGPSTEARSSMPSTPTELPDADPESYTALLEGLRGTPVVVNVWASWCGPCRLEAPGLAEVAAEYGDRVRFLGIDVLDARPDARAFIEEFGWPYPSLFDRTGAIRDSFGLIGQPHTLFYGADGALVDTHLGTITGDQLREEVQALAT
ncbi:MAG TPA: TlpA disulfide reductase family protein [Actinomycetota bacterium]|nr:TlpA disulfide reductase family protein [Actinomycetota bacterium]